jgi:hypothetical protein
MERYSVPRVSYRLDPKSLEPFLDPDEIVGRVRGLAASGTLEEGAERALSQFLTEYDMRASGGNPDSHDFD